MKWKKKPKKDEEKKKNPSAAVTFLIATAEVTRDDPLRDISAIHAIQPISQDKKKQKREMSWKANCWTLKWSCGAARRSH